MIIDGVDLTPTIIRLIVLAVILLPLIAYFISRAKPGIPVRVVTDDKPSKHSKPKLVPCRFYFSDGTSECRPVPEHKMDSLVSYSRAWENFDQYGRVIEVVEDLQTGSMYFVGRK